MSHDDKPDKPTVKVKIPAKLGAAVDLLYRLRSERLALQRDLDKKAAEEDVVRTHLINSIPKSDATGVAGKQARASVVVKPVPIPEDWGAIWKYMKRHDLPELVQRRLNGTAIRERWGAGKVIPGVARFNKVDISLTKLGPKG